MKSFLRTSLMAIAVAFIFGSLSATDAKAQLQEILNRMDAHNKSLQTLSSNVMYVKQNTQIGESDTKEGTVIYKTEKKTKPYVRIDWTKPVLEILASSKGNYVVYRSTIKQAYTGETKNAIGSGKAGGVLEFINMSKVQLKANYSMKYIGAEKLSNGTETFHLELTPKNAASYKVADIWVDKDGMPIQMKATENNNDTTTVLLSGIKKNITLKADAFKVKLPPDTQFVKD